MERRIRLSCSFPRFAILAGVMACCVLPLGCEPRSERPKPESLQHWRNATAAETRRAPAIPRDELPIGERKFLDSAAKHGIAMMEASRIAAERAVAPEVKALANRMRKSYSETNDALGRLASQRQIALPTSPDPDLHARVRDMRDHPGKRLERVFLQWFGVEGQRHVVELFERDGATATDPALRVLAADALPALRRDLALAQRLSSPG